MPHYKNRLTWLLRGITPEAADGRNALSAHSHRGRGHRRRCSFGDETLRERRVSRYRNISFARACPRRHACVDAVATSTKSIVFEILR